MAEDIRPAISKKTLREQVVDVLRGKMLRGELKPGERIVEAEISELFNISRGPVREALRQLEEEGLVTYVAHKGCVVKTLSYWDVQEAYLIRSALEALSVRVYSGKLSKEARADMEQAISDLGNSAKAHDLYGVTEADERFHSRIVEEANCERLYRMWKSLEGANAATYYTMERESLMPFNVLETNHRYILDSFNNEDVEFTCRTVNEHYMVVPEVLHEKQVTNLREKG